VAGRAFLPFWSQFHQHFTRTFFTQNFGAKNYKAKLGFGFEILAPKISYEKRVRKSLMKLTSGPLGNSASNSGLLGHFW